MVADVNPVHFKLRLSANSLVFCRSVTMRPGGPLTASSYAARHPVITGKSNQLLDVAVGVVPLLHHVRQIEWTTRSHSAIGEQNRNEVKTIRTRSALPTAT